MKVKHWFNVIVAACVFAFPAVAHAQTVIVSAEQESEGVRVRAMVHYRTVVDPESSDIPNPDGEFVFFGSDRTEVHAEPFVYATVHDVPEGQSAPKQAVKTLRLTTEMKYVAVRLTGSEQLHGFQALQVPQAMLLTQSSPPADARSMSAHDPAPRVWKILVVGNNFQTPDEIAQGRNKALEFQSVLHGTAPFNRAPERIVVRFHSSPDDLRCSVANGMLGCDPFMMKAIALASGIQHDFLLVLHNTPFYGGTASAPRRLNSAGRRVVDRESSSAVVGNSPGAAGVFVHEFGHLLGLSDEYYNGNNPWFVTGQEAANCSQSCSLFQGLSEGCFASCGNSASLFAPDRSIMYSVTIPHFNRPSIEGPGGILEQMEEDFGPMPNSAPVPASFRAEAQGSLVSLDWNAVPNATYEIAVGVDTYQTIHMLSAATNSLRVPNVPLGLYYLRIRSVVHGQRSPWSDFVIANTHPPLPQYTLTDPSVCRVEISQPVVTVNGRSVRISWEVSNNDSYFEIQAYVPGSTRPVYSTTVQTPGIYVADVAPGTYEVRIHPDSMICDQGAPKSVIFTVP